MTGGDQPLAAAVVATVLNEGKHLSAWLMGLESQTVHPSEVIIVDGGSQDDTLHQLRAWSPPFEVRIIAAPGTSISEGRNAAIAAVSSEVVAVTDAGTVATSDWLERLIEPFAEPAVDVVAGGFRPVLDSRWQRALAAATLPDMEELSGARILPSSRSVAVRRRWLDMGYQYPEWLDYCEDLVWDLQLQRAGARFVFVPDAVVTFAPRASLAGYARQYFRYARGDGRAGLWRQRHVVRYATYAAMLFVIWRRKPLELVLALVLGTGYAMPVVRRAWRRERVAGHPTGSFVKVAGAAILLRACGDVAKMAGYPVGLAWRVRRYGPRASWRRITPDGRLWRPGSRRTENRPPTMWRAGESRRAPR